SVRVQLGGGGRCRVQQGDSPRKEAVPEPASPGTVGVGAVLGDAARPPQTSSVLDSLDGGECKVSPQLLLSENSLKLPQDFGFAYKYIYSITSWSGSPAFWQTREAQAHSQREREIEREHWLTPRLQQTREKQNKTHHTRFI